MKIGSLVKWVGHDEEWRGIVVEKVSNGDLSGEGKRYRILGVQDLRWYEIHSSSKYVEVVCEE